MNKIIPNLILSTLLIGATTIEFLVKEKVEAIAIDKAKFVAI